MLGSLGIVIFFFVGRWFLSLLSFVKGRNIVELFFLLNDGVKENLDMINLDGFKLFIIFMLRIDFCILGKEILEERDKFMVSEKMGYFNIV